MPQTINELLDKAKQDYKEYYAKNKKHRNNYKVQERLEMLNDKVARLESESLKKSLTNR